MKFVEHVAQRLPSYAQDVEENLETTMGRSTLGTVDSAAVALSAAFAARSSYLVEIIRRTGDLPAETVELALSAAALMAMNNTWYPFLEMAADAQLRALPSRLRMNAQDEHEGAREITFEMCALAASIIGKCDFCVSSHLELLKRAGLGLNQLADVGRIASVVHSVAQVLIAEGID